jgi:hypothetical protein
MHRNFCVTLGGHEVHLMFYRCTQHDEVRWSWHAGRFCWFCHAEGVPSYALIVSPLDRDDEVSISDALVAS